MHRSRDPVVCQWMIPRSRPVIPDVRRAAAMAIDGCQHSFGELASDVLPKYMAELRRRMANPFALSEFAVERIGVAALCGRFALATDFSGCYVLLETGRPIYVGISRVVLQRLRQHVRGTTHFDASLAYLIAASRQPHNQTRSGAMADATFRAGFREAQAYLRGLQVAFLEIANPLELYLFEAFAAMELDTCEWNTFETH